MGGAAAAAGARVLIDAGATALASFGLAGGLDASLRPGAICLPREIVGLDGTGFATTAHWRARVESALLARYPVASGKLLSTDRAIASIEEKAALHRSTAAIAVDMESSRHSAGGERTRATLHCHPRHRRQRARQSAARGRGRGRQIGAAEYLAVARRAGANAGRSRAVDAPGQPLPCREPIAQRRGRLPARGHARPSDDEGTGHGCYRLRRRGRRQGTAASGLAGAGAGARRLGSPQSCRAGARNRDR